MELPQLPVPIDQFLGYVRKCSTHNKLQDAVRPFKAYESKLREIFAQEPDHAAVSKNHLVPVFGPENASINTKARDLDHEIKEVKDRYLLALEGEDRRENGTAATVRTLNEFKTNFNLFCESSLVDLDWSNVVAAGSSVVTALLPVNSPHNESKRALRAYYHQNLAPASDVDLFIYGLNEKQAIEKIHQIETKIRDSILSETTTIRTKNAITIVSEYPTRHVQIVLRLYKSVSEILTGFDVDCSCVAYDGQQVWATARALTAFMTQVNTIDLTRRSPSYENRLSKYSHRGFEVHWPGLDRNRIDPTIFERSFSRVMGLARLLVLEKLPHPNDRDTYLAKRREERGRPPLPWNARFRHQLPGNVKDAQPDDVAEWVEEDDVSNYHTFTIPYGPKYNAKRIEKLLFTKDLLLNAEWNRPKDRKTVLHRHPAFFGAVEDVFHDCCGFCPKPETDDDLAAAVEESKVYINGEVGFLKDDPGRQAIGSFHPITDEDWTEMAYVGNTSRLCQAIVDKDLEAVEDWFLSGDPEEVLDVNRRDHAGRTPLQLATMAGTPEIVHCLIDHGARLVSRLYNGLTAFHIAAYRGEAAMVTMILDKSAANEEEEDRKEKIRKAKRRAAAKRSSSIGMAANDTKSHQDESGSENFDNDDDDKDDDDKFSDEITEGSFIKVSDRDKDNTPDDNEDEPDVYNIDVLAWDSPMSPLHLAIVAGKTEMVGLLIKQYGADVLLPVKLVGQQKTRETEGAILSLILALQLPHQSIRKMMDELLSNGAIATQGDMKELSALHFAINEAKIAVVEALQSGSDAKAISKAVNHVSINNQGWYRKNPDTPLLVAIRTRRLEIVDVIMRLGAGVEIKYEEYAKAFSRVTKNTSIIPPDIIKEFHHSIEQPVILAAKLELPEVVSKLVDAGADVNTMPRACWEWLQGHQWGNSDNKLLLDLVRDRIKSLQASIEGKEIARPEIPALLERDETYLDYPEDSYRYWTAFNDLQSAKIVKKVQMRDYEDDMKRLRDRNMEGEEEKKTQTQVIIGQLKTLETKILEKGGKTFYEMHPDAMKAQENNNRYPRNVDSTLDKSPYKTRFSFRDPLLTEAKTEAYIQVFEAVWNGDLDKVKKICLDKKDALQVATQDLAGFTPFSLAVIRGHEQIAKFVLELATIQYQPPEDGPKYRYRLGNPEAEDDDYDSDDSDYQPDDELQVLRELVDERFTIEDIAALSDNVKSKISPLDLLDRRASIWRASQEKPEDAMKVFGLDTESVRYFIYVFNASQASWTWFNSALPEERHRCAQSLIRYAIVKDDIKMLRFLLDTAVALMARKSGDSSIYKIGDDDFTLAIRLGRTEMIGEIIRVTGQAMPLNKMMESSGAKLEQKPKTYQGLTVHGKKRQDWAQRGKGGRDPVAESDDAPLLKAIIEGNLRTAEYFFSDAPLNRYQEFVKAHEGDKRIQSLAQAKGGIDRALSSWLGMRADLTLHMAVMTRPGKEGMQVLEYALKVMPDDINTQSMSGWTPLHLAFGLCRIDAAKALIAAGADQTTRNDKGNNILHTILTRLALAKPKILPLILSLLDQRLIQPLILEKSAHPEPGSMTPLAAYLNSFAHDKDVIPMLRIILAHSEGKDLEIMNGAGDYVLHTMVRSGNDKLITFLGKYRPEMLYWENATGMTPMDVAETQFLRGIIDNPPTLKETNDYTIASQPLTTFVTKKLSEDEKEIHAIMDLDQEDVEGRSAQWYTHRLLQKLAERYPGKRKLVSLFDANEVAKRLAKQQQKKNEENRRQERLGMNSTGMRGREQWEDYDEMRRMGRRRQFARRTMNRYGEWEENNDGDEVERWWGKAAGWGVAHLEGFVKSVEEKES